MATVRCLHHKHKPKDKLMSVTSTSAMQSMFDQTIAWAIAAGFYENTTSKQQVPKLEEEHDEVRYAVLGYRGELEYFEDPSHEDQDPAFWLELIKDGIGDSLVTQLIQTGLRELPLPTMPVVESTEFHIDDLKDAVNSMSEYIDEEDDDYVEEFQQQCIDQLATIAIHYGLSLQECWEYAYSIISKRVGKGTVIDGVFVKEEDL